MAEPCEVAEEAKRLLGWFDHDIARVHEVVARQLNVLQTRSQLLLSVATVALTITGFSGPRIIAVHFAARWSLALGLFFILLSIMAVLRGTLQVRWLSQIAIAPDTEPQRIVEQWVLQRNQKNAFYHWQMLLLVVGMMGYVAALIFYLLFGSGVA
jgi:hypothetical protein